MPFLVWYSGSCFALAVAISGASAGLGVRVVLAGSALLPGADVLMAEYYNPVPVSVSYRGNEERLFKRDFAGELADVQPLDT